MAITREEMINRAINSDTKKKKEKLINGDTNEIKR